MNTPFLMGSTDSVMEDLGRFASFADAYHADAALRAQVASSPRDVLTERGFDLPPNLDVHVSVNTDETFHLVFPPDPNAELDDEALSVVAGGKSASSAGSAGSASTAGTVVVTLGSASSASSAGTAGCAS